MRNIERIQSMGVEELAAFLSTFSTCSHCSFGENGDERCFRIKDLSEIPDCEEGLKKYLETEVEE